MWLASQFYVANKFYSQLCGLATQSKIMLLSDIHEAFSCGLAGRLRYNTTCMRLASIESCDFQLCTLSQSIV